jgi:hypothetical protein
MAGYERYVHVHSNCFRLWVTVSRAYAFARSVIVQSGPRPRILLIAGARRKRMNVLMSTCKRGLDANSLAIFGWVTS